MMLANCIHDMGFRPTKSDPDVWIKASQKADGFKHYEMILCCVDDVTSIGEFPMRAIEGIKAVFKLKGTRLKCQTCI